MFVYLLLAIMAMLPVLIKPISIEFDYSKYCYFFVDSKRVTFQRLLLGFLVIYMLFLLANRDVSIGTDYKNYMFLLDGLAFVSWKDLIEFSKISGLEIGFCFFSKLVLELSNSIIIVFMFWYLVIILLLIKFLDKFSPNINTSMYLFITFSMFNQSMNILRQYVAMAIFLYAFYYLLKNRFYRYLSLMFLACLIHISIIFTLPIAFIRKCSNRISYVISILLVFISFILSRIGFPVIEKIVSLTSYSNYLYKEVSSESGLGLIINLFIFIVLLLYYWDISSRDNNAKYYLFAGAVSLSLNFFISDLAMIGRLMVFYKIFFVVSLPVFIDSIKHRGQGFIIEMCMYVLFFIYYLFSIFGTCFETSPYIFKM